MIAVSIERPYRIVGDDKYQIVEARDLYIYTFDTWVRKGALEKTYFFSVGRNAERARIPIERMFAISTVSGTPVATNRPPGSSPTRGRAVELPLMDAISNVDFAGTAV